MGRSSARPAAPTCPRCAAVTPVGGAYCGICHFDLSTPAPEPTPAPAPEPETEPSLAAEADTPATASAPSDAATLAVPDEGASAGAVWSASDPHVGPAMDAPVRPRDEPEVVAAGVSVDAAPAGQGLAIAVEPVVEPVFEFPSAAVPDQAVAAQPNLIEPVALEPDVAFPAALAEESVAAQPIPAESVAFEPFAAPPRPLEPVAVQPVVTPLVAPPVEPEGTTLTPSPADLESYPPPAPLAGPPQPPVAPVSEPAVPLVPVSPASQAPASQAPASQIPALPAPGAPVPHAVATAEAAGPLRNTRSRRTFILVTAVIAGAAGVLSDAFAWFALRSLNDELETLFTTDASGNLVASDPAGLAGTALLGLASATTGLASLIALLLCLAAFVVWHGYAMKNAQVLAGRPTRHGGILAQVSWIIPGLCFVLPWLNLADVWRASAPPGRRHLSPNSLLVGWLAAWVLSIVTQVVRIGSIGASVQSNLLSAMLSAVALTLLVRYVKTVGGWQDAAMTSGPSRPGTPHQPDDGAGVQLSSQFDWAGPSTPAGVAAVGAGAVTVAATSPAPSSSWTSPQPAAPPTQPAFGGPRANPKDPFSWGTPSQGAPGAPRF